MRVKTSVCWRSTTVLVYIDVDGALTRRQPKIPEKARTRSARTMTTAHARNYMFVRSFVHYNIIVLYIYILYAYPTCAAHREVLRTVKVGILCSR